MIYHSNKGKIFVATMLVIVVKIYFPETEAEA